MAQDIGNSWRDVTRNLHAVEGRNHNLHNTCAKTGKDNGYTETTKQRTD